MICIKCENIISGGISHLKYHLGGTTKHDTRVRHNTIEEIKRYEFFSGCPRKKKVKNAKRKDKTSHERAKISAISTL